MSRYTELPNASFQDAVILESVCFCVDGSLCVFFNTFSNLFLTKQLMLKIYSLPVPETMGIR
jgi:hypothetical protein